jgi:hypothetical protein
MSHVKSSIPIIDCARPSCNSMTIKLKAIIIDNHLKNNKSIRKYLKKKVFKTNKVYINIS